MNKFFKVLFCFITFFTLIACENKKAKNNNETLYLETMEFGDGIILDTTKLKEGESYDKDLVTITFKDDKNCEFYIPPTTKDGQGTKNMAQYTLNDEKIVISSEEENWEGTYKDGVLKIKSKDGDILATFKKRG